MSKRGIHYVQDRLSDPLPGWQAQLKMAPMPFGKPFKRPEIPPNARVNGVLLLLFESETGLELVITLRSQFLPSHKGQLSLPGGRLHVNESVTAAALRETREEIGLIIPESQILGTLSPVYTPNSVNILCPVVAWTGTRSDFVLNPAEVDEAFWLHANQLNTPATETWSIRGTTYTVPFWKIHHVPLWGATAMILSEFRALLAEH